MDRRALLVGAVASLAASRLPAAEPANLLDRAATLPPEERLRLLATADESRMSPGEKLDLAAARIGASTEAALARLPTDAAAARYALRLQLELGAPIDPKLAHSRAADQAAVITRRADRLLRAHGLATGSVADRLRILAGEGLYSDDDSGRDTAVADMNRWLDRARRHLPRYFGRIPNAAGAVAVHRMSAADESAKRGGYRVLPGDGAPPGYFVDLHDIRHRPRWTLPAVVHHELLPGHMMQLPLQQAAAPHALRVRAAPAFIEGWAIYAEQLALDHGFYTGDSRAEIGALHWLLFRLGRSLIDTGINGLGWSRDEAIDRFTGLIGFPIAFATIEGDVDRVRREPGAFAGQAQLWLTLVGHARREEGKSALRAFHDRLLIRGAVPAELIA